MRKFTGIVIALIVLILLIAGSPWLAGIRFESAYRQLISSYNLQGDLNIQIVEYHRHWLHSEAKLKVKVLNNDVLQLSDQLGIDSANLNFNVDQEIQHGPVLYLHTENLPSYFGLAAIHNIVHVSPNNSLALVNSDDLVTFAGNYFKHFQTTPLKLNFEDDDLTIQSQSIEGNIWIFPQRNCLRGDISFFNIVLKDDENTVLMPKAKIYFDQHNTDSGLWLGKSGASISEIDLQDIDENHIRISGLDLKGKSHESSGKVSASHKLDVNLIMFGEQTFGPLHIEISAGGLNSRAIANLITSARDIFRNGELYQSQLRLKMSSMLPRIFAKQSFIKLNALNIVAPQGSFQMTGQMSWPFGEATAADSLELLQDANVAGDAKISKAFVNTLIEYASALPYFRTTSPQRRMELIELQKNMQLANQRNYLFLADIVHEGVLSEASALAFLGLQKDDEPMSLYADSIRNLFMQKQISRELSYMLFWQYLDVRNQEAYLTDALGADQASVKQQFKDQFNTWVKQGYITFSKDDYLISIQKTNGITTMNGKEI